MMNKKEQAAMESLLTQAALRSTSEVLPDIQPPATGSEIVSGFSPIAEYGDSARVEVACTSSIYHGIGSATKTNSQQALHLYSTRILALRALRYLVEQVCASRLRRIDKMIEQELNNQTK